MDIPTIQAEARTHLGSKVNRRIRKAGQLPGIIYGHGEEPEPIAVSAHDMNLHVQHGARILNVDIGGTANKYLIKDVQFDHLQKDIIHFDLARVGLHERVQVEVGIELRGIPKGVSEGGILETLRNSLRVECEVLSIPKTLHPSVAHLEVGQSLLVKEITLPEGVVALDDPEEKVAMVRLLAIHDEETPLEGAEVAGPAEPERIGRVAETDEDKS